MKCLITTIAASTILALTTLVPVTGHAAPAPSTPKMRVTITSVKPTTVTAKHAIVTFHISVKGMVIDTTHMGKANVRGRGHIQVYAGTIPSDAYVHKDLTHHFLAAVAETTLVLKLPPTLLGGHGKHRIFVALAQNNFVLYRVPAASITITAK